MGKRSARLEGLLATHSEGKGFTGCPSRAVTVEKEVEKNIKSANPNLKVT